MNILIGNDHGAIEIKKRLSEYLKNAGHHVDNLGVDTSESVDYPDIAKSVCKHFLQGGYDFAILACGTGIGISIAANKINGIRAALLHDSYSAKMAKAHNNANVVVFGGRINYQEDVCKILKNYMDSDFEGGRHLSRINKINILENR